MNCNESIRTNRTIMGTYKNQYKVISNTDSSYLEQLMQLLQIVWDGDLMSKEDRNRLVKDGLAVRTNNGFNIITKEGIEMLVEYKFISK